jgi:hypothetical protein
MKVINRGMRVLVLLLGLPLFGCGGNLSRRDAELWFDKNERVVRDVDELILQFPSIHRIDPGTPIEFVAKYGAFDVSTLAAYRQIESECLRLGIKNISILRERDGKLTGVRYLLSSVGIAVSSGGFTAIEHTSDEKYLGILRQEKAGVWRIRRDEWYIIKTDQ